MHDLTTHERELVKWLAKAAPVKVNALDPKEAREGGYNGLYNLETDKVSILSPGEWRDEDGTPWCLVLAHEVVHSTQFRTNRESIPALIAAFHINPLLAEMRKVKEEAVAYYGAALLARDFALDDAIPMRRFEAHLAGAPQDVRQLTIDQAKKAVVWLKARAATVDKRLFDDDLARWAAE